MLISPFFILKMINSLDRDERLTLDAGDRGKIFYNILAAIRNLRLNIELTKDKNEFLNKVYKRMLRVYLAQELDSINNHLLNETDNRKTDRIIGYIISQFNIDKKYASDFLNKNKDIISLKFSQQSEEKVIISRTNGFCKVEYIRGNSKGVVNKYDIEDEIEDLKPKLVEILNKFNKARKNIGNSRIFNSTETVNYKLDVNTDSYFGDSKEFEGVEILKLDFYEQLLAFNLYKSLIRTGNMERGIDSFVTLYGETQKASMLEEFLR